MTDVVSLPIAPPLQRPKTRADCVDGPRPCPWFSCKHHLGLDVLPGGSLRLNYGRIHKHDGRRAPLTKSSRSRMQTKLSREAMTPAAVYSRFLETPLARKFAELVQWHEDRPTCALDVAEDETGRDKEGALCRDVVGAAMCLTRERIAQIERSALKKLERNTPEEVSEKTMRKKKYSSKAERRADREHTGDFTSALWEVYRQNARDGRRPNRRRRKKKGGAM